MSPRGRRSGGTTGSKARATRGRSAGVRRGRRGRTPVIPTVEAVTARVSARLVKAANIRAVVRALNSEARKLLKVAAAEREMSRAAASVLRRLERQEKKLQADLERIRKEKSTIKR